MTPMQIDFGKPDRVIGIDLGTTNSLVAYMDLTAPKVIPGDDGDRLVPSVVSLTAAGEVVVGNRARALLTEPGRCLEVARAGWERASRDHTYSARLETLLGALRLPRAAEGGP